MNQLCLAVAVTVLGAMSASAADHVWMGKISDNKCGAKHKTTTQHGMKMSARQCTLACVKEHRAKYVFVSGGKVYSVGNQDFAALEEHAGHRVRLTGEMNGDTITVSNIVRPARKSVRVPSRHRAPSSLS
jgi:type IV secretory pathway TrbL component